MSESIEPDPIVIIPDALFILTVVADIFFSLNWLSTNNALLTFNVLTLTKESASDAIAHGMRDAVSFGPFLVVNGEPSKFTGTANGHRPRTAIGQRKDGIVLFVVIDGDSAGTRGANFNDLVDIMVRYGAYNASNLDGGGSSSLFVDGKLINDPKGFGYTGERYLINAWILK